MWCLWSGRLPGVPDLVLDRDGWLRPVCADHRSPPAGLGAEHPVHPLEQEMLDTYGVDLLPVEARGP